jgi:hypothetical protein
LLEHVRQQLLVAAQKIAGLIHAAEIKLAGEFLDMAGPGVDIDLCFALVDRLLKHRPFLLRHLLYDWFEPSVCVGLHVLQNVLLLYAHCALLGRGAFDGSLFNALLCDDLFIVIFVFVALQVFAREQVNRGLDGLSVHLQLERRALVRIILRFPFLILARVFSLGFPHFLSTL